MSSCPEQSTRLPWRWGTTTSGTSTLRMGYYASAQDLRAQAPRGRTVQMVRDLAPPTPRDPAAPNSVVIPGTLTPRTPPDPLRKYG